MLGRFTRDEDVGTLIARQKYRRAIKVLRSELQERPENVYLRQRLADVLALHGETAEASQMLGRLVDEFAEAGFTAKAIAVVKKMQRIAPQSTEVEERLAELIEKRSPSPAPASATPGDSEEHESELVSSLRTSPLFSSLSGAELLAVIRGLELQTFEPGEIVVSEAEPGSSLFLIAGGRVRVYVRNVSGRSAQLRTLEAGDFFGEISLVTGHRRSATITAATPCELLELDRQTLDQIAAHHPDVPETVRRFCERRAESPEELEARGGLL